MSSYSAYEIPTSMFTKMEETEASAKNLSCAHHEKSQAYE
jgi:hypothetical protein